MGSTATAVNRSDFGRRRFGDLLVRAGLLTERQFQEAIEEQTSRGGRLNDALLRRGVMTEDSLAHALMTQLGLARAQLTEAVDPDLLSLVPRPFAEAHLVVPMAIVGGRTLVVATSDPLDFAMIDWLRARTGCYIEPRVATGTAIREAIDRLYGIVLVSEAESPLELVTTAQDHAQQSVPAAAPVPTRVVPPRLRRVEASEAVTPPPAMSLPRPVEVESATRAELAREVKALRALVQLLVEKGVINLDEYVTRLR